MTKRFSFGMSVLTAVSAFGLAAAIQAAETKGPVTDEIGVVEIPEDAPIVIGGYWTLTGPDTALGLDQKRAVEVAFDEIGNELVGHPIQFIAEDGQCSAEGGQAAATKLASIPNIVAVIGPDCSSSATPGAPILWNAGIVSIGTATTAPSLTAPDRKPDYFGYMRTIYSDADAGNSTPSTSPRSCSAGRSPPFMTAAPMRRSWPRPRPTTSGSSAARWSPKRRSPPPTSTCARC